MKGWLIFLCLMNCNLMIGQSVSGIVIHEETGKPVEFVNIGIAGKDIGTVSDLNGVFSLVLDPQFDKDTLLFSCIGYYPTAISIAAFKKNTTKNVFLKEQKYDLVEVVVKPKNVKERILGERTSAKMVSAGFEKNLLGYEIGTIMRVKKPAFVKEVKINIADCSYDTIYYRLNIYKLKGEVDFENVLQEPIYINISKEMIKESIEIDLRAYNIIIDSDFLVSVEQVKHLGDGYLHFCARLFSENSYFRETSQGSWHKCPARVAISVVADVEK